MKMKKFSCSPFWCYLVLGLVIGLVAFSSPVLADSDVISDNPIGFEADKVEYDDKEKTIVAIGNVIAEQDDNLLMADKVSYNSVSGEIKASGNVSLLYGDGTVIFADDMEIKDGLKEAIGTGMRVLLADDSLLTASKAVYVENEVSTFEGVSYTPCNRCKEVEPLWSLNAGEVIKDEKDLMVSYYNAWLEFKGVPVFYTPYLAHPDPAVQRKSGLLMPIFASSNDLGVSITVPYFIVISDYQDFTFSPMITSKEGILFNGDYRNHFKDGILNASGGITFMDSKRDLRGYIFSDLEYNIDEKWRFKANMNLVSDRTFLRRYNIGDYETPWLENNLKLEYFEGRSYFSLSGMGWQEMRYDIPSNVSPIVAPELFYSYMGSPSDKGGYFTFDSYAAVITRANSSTDTKGLAEGVQKINTLMAWHIPYIGTFGDVLNFEASLRLDAYSINNYPTNNNDDYSGFKGRAFPMLSAEWRYPMIYNGETSYQVLEPVVSAVLSPNGCNPEEIPNEDSLDFELDDTNLFSRNRYVGYDRVESGSRVSYGLNWSVYGGDSIKLSAFAGQSYSFTRNPFVLASAGLNDYWSDYVGKIGLELPKNNVSFNYRFRLKKDNLNPEKNELSVAFGTDMLQVSGYYLDVKEINTEYSTIPDREEVGLNLNLRLNKNWYTNGWWTYDLTSNGGPVQWGVGLRYEDECFALNLGVKKEYSRDVEDYDTGTSVMLMFTLKTIGSIKTN